MQNASNDTHLHNIAGHQPTVTGRQAKPKLSDQLREALRSRHYSRRTEQTYCHWVKRFIYFHSVRHPSEMGEPEINAFLTHLAVKEKVSASTQNQALSARYMKRTWPTAGAVCRCPTLLTASIPTPRGNGAGNGSSPRKTDGATPRPARRGGITSMSRLFRRPCVRR